MSVEIILPKVGLMATEVTLIQWLTKEGDFVTKGTPIMEVLTDKVNMEIEAEHTGVILSLTVKEGDKVSVPSVVGFMEIREELSAEREEDKMPMWEYTGATVPTSLEKEEALDCDLLVLGAGPGGYVAAIRAAQRGLQTIIVDKGAYGGTCLNVGCIPTKAFVKSAHLYREILECHEMGIQVNGVGFDFEKVWKRKTKVKDQLKGGVEALLRNHGVQCLCGTASFVSAQRVDVIGSQGTFHINAKNTIIATGSKTSALRIPGVDGSCVLNSDDALDLRELPRSITVIGGGVIGMEFASIFNSFGVKVHVVEFLDRILATMDEDVSFEMQTILQGEGIHIHTSSKVLEIEESEDGQAIVTYQNGDRIAKVVSDKVLMAVGREPNLDGLMLENAGVRLWEKKKGIQVDEFMKTNVPNIYAIGDATNIIQLAHVASHQGLCAIDHILGGTEQMHLDLVPGVVYTHPEVASVGKTEAECKKEQIPYATAKFPYFANGKALIMNESKGFVKIIQNKESKKIIGASIIGPEADAAINILTLAIRFGLTDKDLAGMIFPHPSTSEAIHECALGLSESAIHLHKRDYP